MSKWDNVSDLSKQRRKEKLRERYANDPEYRERIKNNSKKWQKANRKRKVDLWIDDACKWIEGRVSFGVHPCSGYAVVLEFRDYMDKKYGRKKWRNNHEPRHYPL